MDSNHHSNYKLTKTEKKFLRKQIKARHTLLRHEGVETVSYATQVTKNLLFECGPIAMLMCRSHICY